MQRGEIAVFSKKIDAERPPKGWVKVAIDRGTPLGNPRAVGTFDFSESALTGNFKLFAKDLERMYPLKETVYKAIEEIRTHRNEGRSVALMCWCKKRPTSKTRCHGDVLIKFILDLDERDEQEVPPGRD